MIKNILTNSFGILISRIFGFIRDMLTATILGANVYSDIFFIAFKLPNLFRRIFAEGAFTQCFIPSYALSKNKVTFSSVVFLQFIVFILVLSLIVSLFSNIISGMIAIGFSQDIIDLAAPLVAINFFYLPLIFVVTFLAALLQYKNHFATTAYSTALLNLSMITALLLAQGLDKYTITYYLSYGVIVGGFLQVFVHIIAIKKLNMSRNFTFRYKHLKYKFRQTKFYKQFYPAVFGSSASHLSAFLDTWLASFLVSGSISYLYYANRVFQLPLALFAIATSVALFPTVAKAIAKNDINKSLFYLKKAFILLSIVLFISSLIGIVFSDFIVELLFQRGEFSSIDTQNTSLILSMYLIGLVPFGLAKIFSLWLFAHNKQLIAAKITLKALSFNIVLSIILIFPLQAVGLALASSLSGIVLFYLTIKEFGYNNFLELLKAKK